MYWGGRGVSPKIEQANMDGSGRTTLVSSGLMWVNSLAMDYQNRLLYWCDAKLHKIERVDLQGNNRMVILDLSLDSMHLFGLALFGNALYWSDWKSQSVHKYNMSTSLKEVVVRGMGNPMDLHIYDQSKYFVAVTCPALLTPPNGIRQGCTGTTTEYYNTLCLFFCNAGFNAVGSPSRRCLEKRTWSGQDFLCQAVTCPALVAPPNGIRQGCTGTTTEYYNTVCLFSCNAGFDAVGSLSRKCLENGNWSGQDFLCQETSSSGNEVILEHTSSLAIAVGSSIGVFAFLAATISVAILCMRKRGFLIRTWRRVIGRENVGENNQGYEERDGNENNVQRANVAFQNQHNQGRWQLYIREENVGENNQGYDDRDGNQNNLAGSVELQLANHGIRRSPAESSQIDAASSDNGATAGSSASAAPDERGSGENPVTEKHCFCISHHVGVDWKKVLRKLSMAEMTIRNLDEDYKHCQVAEKCYQGLLKWKESFGPQGATIKKLCDALQNVGCSEALEALRSMSHQSDC